MVQIISLPKKFKKKEVSHVIILFHILIQLPINHFLVLCYMFLVKPIVYPIKVSQGFVSTSFETNL